MPPYLKETVAVSQQRITELWRGRQSWVESEILASLSERKNWLGHSALRAGFSMAWMDWFSRRYQTPVIQYDESGRLYRPETVMTIGICSVAEALEQLKDLPKTGALKLKVGDGLARERVGALLQASDARILLDGNQGLESVEKAAVLAEMVSPERLLGFEQPFSTECDAWNKELYERTRAVVYADESVQGLNDLERASSSFGGVNIKLMKCGGLDHAQEIAATARSLGLKVMLGSMSESSLGCTAMAHLQSAVDIVDLDGPWLLANDPFEGVSLDGGRLKLPTGPGFGVRPVHELDYYGI